MSSGPEVFPFSSGPSSEPTFEKAFNGYDKKQVDRYVQQVEAEIAALAAEREETYAQITMLNQHVVGLQAELDSARRFVASGDTLSYRHLGPRVEQILALAEEQAEDLRSKVEREFAEREQSLVALRAQLDAQAHDATRNFEASLAARRTEEEQASARRLVSSASTSVSFWLSDSSSTRRRSSSSDCVVSRSPLTSCSTCPRTRAACDSVSSRTLSAYCFVASPTRVDSCWAAAYRASTSVRIFSAYALAVSTSDRSSSRRLAEACSSSVRRAASEASKLRVAS